MPHPQPGSIVRVRRRRWRVDRCRVDRRTARLDLSERSGRLTVFTPFDRPQPLGQDGRIVRTRRRQGRARLAKLLGSHQCARLVHAAVDGHLRILPHQIDPVLAVLDGRRRILIADEVGLGKTVQGALIAAEVVRRYPAARVLVIAPAALRQQWADELQTRFSLDSRPAEAALDAASSTTLRQTNPWWRPGVWTVSIDYVKQSHVLAGLPLAAWDVVIIDEAHLATGDSSRHDACDELGRRARHLILLSATPHDGDVTRFARLMRLGRLPVPADALTIFRRTRADVPLPLRRVVRWMRVRATPATIRLLDTLRAFERTVLEAVRPSSGEAAILLLSVFRKRGLSTVAALASSLTRRLEWLEAAGQADCPAWRQPGLPFAADDIEEHERHWLTADAGLPRARERAWIRRLIALAAAAAVGEPKLARVVAYATRTREPLVIFTEFRHSLEALARLLEPIRPLAAIHGGQSDDVRQQQLRRFLTGEASVLLTTDVGSQGLNLQTRARWIVSLELPWNPMRLEQRIGRLDRIGQPHRVHASLLVADHPMESAVLASIARRTVAAQRDVDDSTLAAVVPPSHLTVATTLLVDASTRHRAAPREPTPPICPDFRRQARAQAVVIERRRRLNARWRGSAAAGRRPTRSPMTLGEWAPGSGAVVVWAGTILDGLGDVVERRLFALAVPRIDRRAGLDPAHIAACRSRLLAHLRRRIRRLQPAVARTAEHRLQTERAITIHLHHVGRPHEAQLGLFSQREAIIFQSARERAALAAEASAVRLEAEQARARLDAGPTAIVWIGDRR